jgi:RNA polymerase subunit RPABC4/transcription elongation factor Spt4
MNEPKMQICPICGGRIRDCHWAGHKAGHESKKVRARTEEVTIPMRKMMIKCKNSKCGAVHPSMMQMDENTFKTSTLTNNSEQCPKCGKMSTYNKPDYFFE